jgi:hypothetical protein
MTNIELTKKQLLENAVSSLWEVYYATTNRKDDNIVIDAIIKIQELESSVLPTVEAMTQDH